MTDMTRTDSLVRKVCRASIMAIFFVTGGGLHGGGLSRAGAEPIDMATYCYHFHNWALSGTTGVDSPLCRNLGSRSRDPVSQDEFCFHVHRFALNQTSILVGDASAEIWCNSFEAREQSLPEGVFYYHYHNNAGTGTTEPVR